MEALASSSFAIGRGRLEETVVAKEVLAGVEEADRGEFADLTPEETQHYIERASCRSAWSVGSTLTTHATPLAVANSDIGNDAINGPGNVTARDVSAAVSPAPKNSE